ncbi:hypothetical protein HanIR_Chr06g0284311 [Helianthus annuus]|nr:hypothetical protein HanIR_Chr06g0284311 [Helianthus annuus]
MVNTVTYMICTTKRRDTKMNNVFNINDTNLSLVVSPPSVAAVNSSRKTTVGGHGCYADNKDRLGTDEDGGSAGDNLV